MDVKLRYELDLAPESRWNILSSTAAAKNALLYAQEAGDFYAGKDYYTTRQGAESFLIKLTISGCDDRRKLTYHKMLLAGELPLTIGGGIGQSRLSMLLLGKAHIGEVQASVWDEETTAACEKAGIRLL